MTKEIDAGPLLGQEDLSLEGNLEDIFSKNTEKGIKITKNIIDNGLEPKQQNHALATFYKRRKPEESEITIEELKSSSAEYLHNKIRMLQDSYPNAFIKTFDGKITPLTSWITLAVRPPPERPDISGKELLSLNSGNA